MLKIIISKYTLIVLGLVLLPILILEFFAQSPTRKDSVPQFNPLIAELNQNWLEGAYSEEDLEGCADIPEGDGRLCSGKVMECYLRKKAKVIRSQTNLKGDYYVVLERGKRKFSLRFRNTCHRVSLKEKIYSAGPKGIETYLWSNEGQDIKIDRFYARKDGKIITNYSISQQKDFCRSQRGYLLQSHVFDAASFYPTSTTAGLKMKSLYPWTKSSRFNPDCEKLTAKGCENLAPFDRRGTSWSGIFHALGGGIESLDNPFKTKANLKVSSLEFDNESPWHQLGLRAFWDGEKFGTINLEEQYFERLKGVVDLKEVVFRCMYY